MDEYNTDVFRQNIKIGTKHYGKVGFDRILGRDYLYIRSFEGIEDGDECATFPLEAVPQLVALLIHAYSTKNRPTADDTYSFPRLEEKV